jgi:hypothetical protein
MTSSGSGNLQTWDTGQVTDNNICPPATTYIRRFIVQFQCSWTTGNTRIRVNYQTIGGGGSQVWFWNWYLVVANADFDLYATYQKSDGFTEEDLGLNTSPVKCNDDSVDFTLTFNPP